ncbi:hypothetical protein RRG08_067170, partial [Elysia crispata]
TSVTNKTDYLLRYSVEVKVRAIRPEDLGLRKMLIVSGLAKDGERPVILSFRVNAEGPPKCPLEVNVKKETNNSITVFWMTGQDCGASQHFIVCYSRNSSTDDRKWHWRTVPVPSNSSYVSSTIDNVPADTGFLFRVFGVNTLNADMVNSSTCGEDTVEARTFPNHHEVDIKSPTKTPENVDSRISMLHITIGVSVLAVTIIIIVVIIIFIFRKRDSSSRPREFETLTINSVYGLPSYRDPPMRDFKYPNPEETKDDWNCAERQSQDHGDGRGRPTESETLVINTVYGLVRDVGRNSDAPYRGPTSYVNQESLSSVSTDKSEMDGGGNGSVNTRPFLKKKIDPRYQLNPEVEGTEHADLDFPTTNA